MPGTDTSLRTQTDQMPHLFPPPSLACLLFSLAPPTTSHGFSHRKRQTATEWVFFFLFFFFSSPVKRCRLGNLSIPDIILSPWRKTLRRRVLESFFFIIIIFKAAHLRHDARRGLKKGIRFLMSHRCCCSNPELLHKW